MTFNLNPDQATAVEAMADFLSGPERFFLLEGAAGTGKTYCLQALIERTRGRFVFTAPTNKATRVLRQTLTRDDYKPECRTIFSLLGLRLEPNGEIKELAYPEDPIDLSKYAAVFIDEAGMVNAPLERFVRLTGETYGVKFIYVGDPAQLPPVGETRSAVWSTPHRAALTQVMRHDNEILALATRIRAAQSHPVPNIRFTEGNSDGQGVWNLKSAEWIRAIRAAADAGDFSKPDCAKIIAWRNVTVDGLNKVVRQQLFAEAATRAWLPTDRVIFTAPAKDLSDEPIAATDDEGVIEDLYECQHPAHGDMTVWRMTIMLDTGALVTAYVLHERSLADFTRRSAEMAEAARTTPRKWKAFWEFKDSFHQLRHGYAITAHRAQGSTYRDAYVNWHDILLNRSRKEAFQCLYVACTRPKERLFLGS
jgi:hypothetical protein